MIAFKKPKSRFLRYAGLSFGILLLIFSAIYVYLQFHKKEILNSVVTELNKNINGKIIVGDLDFSLFERFPAFSLQLKDMLVVDSIVAEHGDTLLQAGELSFQISLLKLLVGQVSFNSVKLANASISLIKTTDGLSNTHLLKSSAVKKQGTGKAPTLSEIHLSRVGFNYIDSMKRKFFSFQIQEASIQIEYPDSSISLKAKCTVHTYHLIFNVQKGGYLTDKVLALNFDGKIIPGQNEFSITHGLAIVDQQKLRFNGDFLLGTNPEMKLNFTSSSILPSVAYSILPPVISNKLSKYHLKNPVMTAIFVNGSLAPGRKPAVDIYFKTSGNQLEYANRSLDSLKLLGWFTNHIDSSVINDDHNSRVSFPVFNFSFVGIPLKSKVTITDLMVPHLRMNTTCDIDKNGEAAVVDPDQMKIVDGALHMRFLFDGPLVNYIDTPNQKFIAHLTGSLKMDQLSLDYLPAGYEFRNVNGSFDFDENDLRIDSINMEVNKNTFKLTGSVKQFISFLFIHSVKAQADLTLNAGSIDLDNFKSADSAKSEKKSVPEKEEAKNSVATTIDWIIDKLELNFDLTADKLKYQRFNATDIQSQLTLAKDYVRFKNAKMNLAKGTFSFSGAITNLNNPVHAMSINAAVRHADIADLFYAFDNFNQQTFTHKDIDGKIDATLLFNTQLNRTYNVIPSSMRGLMKVTITAGKLRSFEAVQQIVHFVDKKRDFSFIEFSKVVTIDTLIGSQISISQLDVYSSLLNMFVFGTYDFNKTNTSLTVKVPFKGILNSAEKQQEVSEVADAGDKKGMGFVFKAKYTDNDKIVITPVIFGKKKNRLESEPKVTKSDSQSKQDSKSKRDSIKSKSDTVKLKSDTVSLKQDSTKTKQDQPK